MNSDKPPTSAQSPLLRDYELDSMAIGPAARMLLIEPDPHGGVYYQFGRRKAQFLHLGEAMALRPLVLLDMVQLAAFLDPFDCSLRALVGFVSAGTHVFLFGPDWRIWIDEDGRRHRGDVLLLMRQARLPVSVQERQSRLGFNFSINPYQRELYSRQLDPYLREQQRHILELRFRYPAGTYDSAMLEVEETSSRRLLGSNELTEFPIMLQSLPRVGELVKQEGAAPRNGPQKQHAGSSRAEPVNRGGRGAARPADRTQLHRKSGGSGQYVSQPQANQMHNGQHPPVTEPAAERPIPQTDHLNTQELMGLLSIERDPERRWKMIEPNLMLGRPERTYPLILNYSDLIAENVQYWPPARLKMAFRHQPGAVLIGLMHGWQVNQVLALVEDNAEADKILQWLREREIERMLMLDLRVPPTSGDSARKVLNIDRFADAAAIKKAWRILLGFLNADLGRSEERPIHRKKDEVAKHLQTARNLLMRNR